MIDPERLSRNSSSPLASLLLRAGAEERPSAVALRRATKAATLAAAASSVAKAAGATAAGAKLAAVGTASGGTSAAIGGGAITLGSVAQWLGIGLLSGMLTVPLVRAVIPEPEPKPANVLAPSPPAVTPRDPATLDARSVPGVVPSGSSNEPAPSKAIEERRAKTPGVAPTLDEAVPTTSALLAAEVKFVDQGRAALKRGAAADALALLASYEARFPRQQLLTEVLFLRMEAENRLGNIGRARALAELIVARGIAGPQAARARELLDR